MTVTAADRTRAAEAIAAGDQTGTASGLIAAVAQVIGQRAREFAAEELRAAASEVMQQHGTASLAAKRIRTRAVALDASRPMNPTVTRQCECPTLNPDCEHPTCPRWPQPGHLRGEFLNDLAACVGQNSLGSFAIDLDRLLSAHVAAELRRVADEIDQDGDAASLMEYDELAGGHHRSAQLLRIRAEQMEPHQ